MLKVLVVDDDEDVRELVKIWLKDKYEVDAAIDGNDCLRKIKQKKYDIILLDVMMPGPRPAELIPKIAKVLPDVKIIYLTAVEMFNPTPEQERKGWQPVITKEVKGYLVKPIDKEQLLAKIKDVLTLEKLLKKPKEPIKLKKLKKVKK